VRWTVPILTVSVLVQVQEDAQKAAKKELAMLQGSWVRVSAEVDGKKVPDEELKKTRLVITSDRYTLKSPDQTRQGGIRLDPTKTPKTIDLMSTEGPNKGQTLLGIYELGEGLFRYCVAPPGKERPKEFVSKPGTGVGLYANKREP
jgi:uncharacterized protein (TIGR03067 family)